MSVKLYFDVHVRRAIIDGLRLRGVDVVTAQEDGSDRLTDSDLLDRASSLQRLLFTHDDDLLSEAALRQIAGRPFSRLIYAHQLALTIGQCVEDLEIVAKASDPEDWTDSVVYLPL